MVEAVLQRINGVVLQTLAGSAAFALLATAIPMVMFSGHDGIESLLHDASGIGAAGLLVLALAKILAAAISGWRGGAIFPLLFAGGAAGGALVLLFPQIPLTVAVVGAMSAITTVGMGRPVIAALIALLLIGPASIGALVAGVFVGWVAARRWPGGGLH